MSLLGWVLSGALVAAWALTSARHVCAAQPLDWRAFAKATSTGGMVAPIVAVAELLIGEPVWIAIGTGAVLWLHRDPGRPVHVAAGTAGAFPAATCPRWLTRLSLRSPRHALDGPAR